MGYIKGIVITVVVLVVGTGFWLLNYGPGSKHAILEKVRYQLSDPESAKFRDVVLGKFALCGEINTKNRMGGYIGYRRFMQGYEPYDVLEVDNDGFYSESLVEKLCVPDDRNLLIRIGDSLKALRGHPKSDARTVDKAIN